MGKWYCPPTKEIGLEIYNCMSRSPAKSGKAIAMKSLKEKWLSMVQSAREKGENGTGGSSIVTQCAYNNSCCFWVAQVLNVSNMYQCVHANYKLL